MSQIRIKIDFEKCTGCRLCEVMCSLQHTGTVNPKRSRIKIFDYGDFFLPVIAGPYVDAGCNSKFDAVIKGREVDGCLLCRASCPSKSVIFKEPDSQIPLKCDFCGEPPDPQCVKWCPMGALTVEQESDKRNAVISWK